MRTTVIKASVAVCRLALLACALGTLCSMGARHSWVLELFSHFSMQYALLAFIAGVVFAVMKSKPFVILALMLVIINLFEIAPLYAPVDWEDGLQENRLRVVSFNVLSSNTGYEAAIDFIREADADVIALYEVDHRWKDAIQKAALPYSMSIVARMDNFGMAMLSRLPESEMTTQYLGNSEVPSMSLRARYKGLEIALLAIHPEPPMSAAYAESRNETLDLAGKWAQAQQTLSRKRRANWSSL